MASSRDAESCFASPLELGIADVDITEVIDLYSNKVAVLGGESVGSLALSRNAGMGLGRRRVTESVPGQRWVRWDIKRTNGRLSQAIAICGVSYAGAG
jgi:hypothetical protein